MFRVSKWWLGIIQIIFSRVKILAQEGERCQEEKERKTRPSFLVLLPILFQTYAKFCSQPLSSIGFVLQAGAETGEEEQVVGLPPGTHVCQCQSHHTLLFFCHVPVFGAILLCLLTVQCFCALASDIWATVSGQLPVGSFKCANQTVFLDHNHWQYALHRRHSISLGLDGGDFGAQP